MPRSRFISGQTWKVTRKGGDPVSRTIDNSHCTLSLYGLVLQFRMHLLLLLLLLSVDHCRHVDLPNNSGTYASIGSIRDATTTSSRFHYKILPLRVALTEETTKNLSLHRQRHTHTHRRRERDGAVLMQRQVRQITQRWLVTHTLQHHLQSSRGLFSSLLRCVCMCLVSFFLSAGSFFDFWRPSLSLCVRRCWWERPAAAANGRATLSTDETRARTHTRAKIKHQTCRCPRRNARKMTRYSTEISVESAKNRCQRRLECSSSLFSSSWQRKESTNSVE